MNECRIPARLPVLRLLRAGLIAAATAAGAAMAQTPLPQYVNLTPQQTPVKDQGGRDTCGSFATIAAIEALYRRQFGLTLDLSEQYLNHWAQQMESGLFGRPLPQNETQAGSVGGGGMGRPLSALSRGLALPAETALPYVPDAAYQNADAGDSPALNDWSRLYTQRAVDDFNLADAPNWYVWAPPALAWTTVMPQTALDAARYRPTGVTWITGTDVNNIDRYRSVLASGREVIMEFRCCDGNPGYHNPNPWMLPQGSNGGGAAHVVTVVGYDDSLQLFRIKNSWGSAWADGGYSWVSYDVVRRAALRAAYLNGVVSPSTTADPFNFRHYALGRWQLKFDGWTGVLDVYNLPDAYVPGQARNYRVGTLFMADGRVNRVNGYFSGNALVFYVDWAKPDLPVSQLSGLQFSTWMFTNDHKAMAGTLRDPVWGTFPAAAVKAKAPISGTAAPGGLAVSSYLGTWDFSHDGRKGRLEITSANATTRQLSGRYVDANNVAYSLSGTVQADARLFNLTIGFAAPQNFTGYLSGRERGVMGGSTVWSGLSFGFYGTRRP